MHSLRRFLKSACDMMANGYKGVPVEALFETLLQEQCGSKQMSCQGMKD